jgi:hypothetical protein
MTIVELSSEVEVTGVVPSILERYGLGCGPRVAMRVPRIAIHTKGNPEPAGGRQLEQPNGLVRKVR